MTTISMLVCKDKATVIFIVWPWEKATKAENNMFLVIKVIHVKAFCLQSLQIGNMLNSVTSVWQTCENKRETQI